MRTTVDKIKDAMHHFPELLIVFLSPAFMQIGIVTLAIFTDTATAIWAARKSDEAITSKKASPLINKILVYWLILLLAHGVDLAIEMDYGLKLITLALLGMELMSIDENFKKATGKSIFKPLINKITKK